MPTPYMRSISPAATTSTGGGSTSAAFTETIGLTVRAAETAGAQTEADTYAISLAVADSMAEQSEGVTLTLPTPDYTDDNVVPTESPNFKVRVWLSATAATGNGATNPTNVNGGNNGTIGTLQSAVAGAATNDFNSALGANIPAGVTLTSLLYRGWFKSVNTLGTSAGTIVLIDGGAGIGDIAVFSNSAVSTTVDHLTTSFSLNLFALGVDTLAKAAAYTCRHRTVDVAPGVSPHVMTVDAGALEIAAAFS